MTDRIITDISDFIFVSDKPCKVDAVFLPGGSHPEQPEYAAELYKKGFTVADTKDVFDSKRYICVCKSVSDHYDLLIDK